MIPVRLVCQNCHNQLNIDSQNNILFCPYCGEKSLIPDSEKTKQQRIKSNVYRDVEFSKHNVELERIRSDDRANKRFWDYKIIVIILACSLTFVLIYLSVYAINKHEKKQLEAQKQAQQAEIQAKKEYEEKIRSQVVIPISLEEAKGKDYLEIKQYYIDAGFTNIKTIEDGRKDIFLTLKDGEVLNVSINGSTSYSSGQRKDPDSLVVITYYAY